jgi:hypothetical protein
MPPLDHATAGDRLEQLFALVRPLPAPERSLDPSAAKGQTYAHG